MAPARQSSYQRLDAPRMLEQLQNAVLKNAGQGQTRLTLQLNPEELGQLNVMLTVKGKELSATIRAENHEAAQVLGENLESIRQTLEDQGLKVQRLEVQTGLAGFQGNGWNGAEQHNLAREQGNAAQSRNRWRLMRGEGDSLAAEAQETMVRQASHPDSGLHLVA